MLNIRISNIDTQIIFHQLCNMFVAFDEIALQTEGSNVMTNKACMVTKMTSKANLKPLP